MYNLKEYNDISGDLITEETGKNLHLEHLEDNVLNRGVNGARESINFLRSLRDMLSGNSPGSYNVTTKWDGAPAIFAGINPDNGKFFIGTKGIFNKTAKLNYTDDDIDTNHPSPGLNKKLKVALRYLAKLNITGIIQGDMLWSRGDISTVQIQGVPHISFQPNTIVYTVPADSKLSKSMTSSQMGIVFHTSYTGTSMESMEASFNVDIGKLAQTKDVWFRDASLVDASGTVTFTESETIQLGEILTEAGRLFRTINPITLNRIPSSDIILTQIKTFMNTKVREGTEVKDTVRFTAELIRWVELKYNNSIIEAKKEDTKRKRIAEKNEMMRFYRGSSNDLKMIFDLMNHLVGAKLMFVRKMGQMKSSVGTYIKTDDAGLRVTGPEGFVAVDHTGKNALKLIDRLSFSHTNFTAHKNWSK